MSQGLCPSCGAAVNLTAGQTETKCQYCDTPVTLQQAEAQFNEVKSSKMGGTLLIAQTAQEGENYDEAIAYYNKIIEQQPDFADAWLNKGICMVNTSTIGNLKIREAGMAWKNAVKFAKHQDAMKKRVSVEINKVVADFYPVLERFYIETAASENAVIEHFERFLLLESAQDVALKLNPESKLIAENGLELCELFSASVQEGYETKATDRVAKIKAEERRKRELRGEESDSDTLGDAIMTMGIGSATTKFGQELARKFQLDLIPIRTKYLNALEKSAGASHPAVIKAKKELEQDAKERDQINEQTQKQEAADDLEKRVDEEACKSLLGKATSKRAKSGTVGGVIIFLGITIPGAVLVEKTGLHDDQNMFMGIFFAVTVIIWFTLGFIIRKPIKARLQAGIIQSK